MAARLSRRDPRQSPPENRARKAIVTDLRDTTLGSACGSTIHLNSSPEAPGWGDVSFLQLFLNAFGVAFAFNLFDLLLLDWLMFCTITPKFVVIPGTEGMEGYKDYSYHFRASLIGTVLSVVAGLVIAGIVSFL